MATCEHDRQDDICWECKDAQIADLEAKLAEAQAQRDAWIETAGHFQRAAEYYRSLVIAIGEKFGAPAMTSDDGSIQDEVLCAKVPELVVALKATLEQAREALDDIRGEADSEKPDRKPLIQLQNIVAWAETALAALDVGSPQPPFPLALAQEWAAAYAALSSGRDAAESNRLELAYNGACERLYEAIGAGKEAGG